MILWLVMLCGIVECRLLVIIVLKEILLVFFECMKKFNWLVILIFVILGLIIFKIKVNFWFVMVYVFLIIVIFFLFFIFFNFLIKFIIGINLYGKIFFNKL